MLVNVKVTGGLKALKENYVLYFYIFNDVINEF